MNAVEQQMSNPPSKYFVGVGVLLVIAFNAVGMIFSLLVPVWQAQVVVMLLSLAISIALAFRILTIVYIQQPKTVLVDDPLVLSYRTRKPRSVRLEQLEWVEDFLGDQDSLAGRISTGGRIKVKGDEHPTVVTYEIAHAIREQYIRQLGRSPNHPP